MSFSRSRRDLTMSESTEQDAESASSGEQPWPDLHHPVPIRPGHLFDTPNKLDQICRQNTSVLDEWLRQQAELNIIKSSKPVGRYGDFAFLPHERLKEINYTSNMVRGARHSRFLPIQTVSFMYLPRELRDMIYQALLEPFYYFGGDAIMLTILDRCSLKYHPTRNLHDIHIEIYPQQYFHPMLAQSFEALRNFANSNSQIREEIGQLFWKNIVVCALNLPAQQCLPTFLESRPAITHLTLLDLGGWDPMWNDSSSAMRLKTRVFEDLSLLDVTYDFLKMEIITFGSGNRARLQYAPTELWEADIVSLLSSFDASNTNNFETNLMPSNYEWIGVFRKVSRKVKKQLYLKIVRIPEGPSHTEWMEHSPLLEWHLCPWKRPTFMSILANANRLWLPPKQGRDMGYALMHLGRKDLGPPVMKREGDEKKVVSLFGGTSHPIAGSLEANSSSSKRKLGDGFNVSSDEEAEVVRKK